MTRGEGLLSRWAKGWLPFLLPGNIAIGSYVTTQGSVIPSYREAARLNLGIHKIEMAATYYLNTIIF